MWPLVSAERKGRREPEADVGEDQVQPDSETRQGRAGHAHPTGQHALHAGKLYWLYICTVTQIT